MIKVRQITTKRLRRTRQKTKAKERMLEEVQSPGNEINKEIFIRHTFEALDRDDEEEGEHRCQRGRRLVRETLG